MILTVRSFVQSQNSNSNPRKENMIWTSQWQQVYSESTRWEDKVVCLVFGCCGGSCCVGRLSNVCCCFVLIVFWCMFFQHGCYVKYIFKWKAKNLHLFWMLGELCAHSNYTQSIIRYNTLSHIVFLMIWFASCVTFAMIDLFGRLSWLEYIFSVLNWCHGFPEVIPRSGEHDNENWCHLEEKLLALIVLWLSSPCQERWNIFSNLRCGGWGSVIIIDCLFVDESSKEKEIAKWIVCFVVAADSAYETVNTSL